MDNFIQPGNVLELTAPVGGVASGEGYLIGSLFVVATTTEAAAALFRGQVVGVVQLTKAAPQVWAEGDQIFWDDTGKEATNVGPEDAYIGVASEAALSAAVVGNVRLNEVGQAAPVTFAATQMFVSNEQTGDGTEQDVAHGLGAVPAGVLIVPTDTAPVTAGDYTSAQGTHDATNVKVTVTTGKKYVVWAMA